MKNKNNNDLSINLLSNNSYINDMSMYCNEVLNNFFLQLKKINYTYIDESVEKYCICYRSLMYVISLYLIMNEKIDDSDKKYKLFSELGNNVIDIVRNKYDYVNDQKHISMVVESFIKSFFDFSNFANTIIDTMDNCSVEKAVFLVSLFTNYCLINGEVNFEIINKDDFMKESLNEKNKEFSKLFISIFSSPNFAKRITKYTIKAIRHID